MDNKTFEKKAIRHGEVMLIPVDALPENMEQIYEGQEYVVGHSETGHVHTAVGSLTVFRPVGADSQDIYLRVNKESRVEHRKSFDKHETKTLHPGIYKVTIKRAYDYFKKALRKVMD